MGATIQELFLAAAFEGEIDDLKARIKKLELVTSCLLDHYLNCYDGSRDALASEAEKLIPNWETLMENWKPKSP